MAATARAQGALGEINTLLGKGTTFEGKLTFEGTVRIDGKLKGEVFSDDVLIIGEVIIQGTVVGNVRAKRSIEIHSPGKVKGDLHTPSLQVDKGVVFEGRSFMEAATAGRTPAPSAPPQPAAKPAGPTPVK